MSTRSVSYSRRSLAAGAALVGCSLVAAHADASNLANTTLQALSASMSIGSQTATFSATGPVSSWSTYQVTPGVGRSSGLFGYQFNPYVGPMVGFVLAFTGDSYSTSGSGSGFFTVTFTTRVKFFDGTTYAPWPAPTWDVGGTSIANADEFGPGTYTFNFSFAASGAASNNYYAFRAAFFEAPASGVPLPGAAGLAACGLLGLNRRRRR